MYEESVALVGRFPFDIIVESWIYAKFSRMMKIKALREVLQLRSGAVNFKINLDSEFLLIHWQLKIKI